MFKIGDVVELTEIGCDVILEEGHKVGDRVVLLEHDEVGWIGGFSDNEMWFLTDCEFVKVEDEE